MRIGLGCDVHALVEARPLILGGVRIPYEKGLLGHSDADALVHAVIDALLGALALGDIGKLYPDTDGTYRGADSMALLADTMRRVHAAGYRVGNVDCIIIAQQPKMAPYIDAMRASLAAVLEVEEACVSVKAKTNEHLGYLGRGEAIETRAVALLHKQ